MADNFKISYGNPVADLHMAPSIGTMAAPLYKGKEGMPDAD